MGLSMDDRVWNHTAFSKNRDRLIAHEVATAYFQSIPGQAERAGLLSIKHFTVDGTLIEACASMKSFRPKGEADQEPPQGDGRNPEVDFRRQNARTAPINRRPPPTVGSTKRQGQRVQALLHGPCPDGKSQRPGGR